MAGLVPAIHVLQDQLYKRRGCPAHRRSRTPFFERLWPGMTEEKKRNGRARASIGNPRQYANRLERSDRDGRWARAAGRCLPPGERRHVSGHPDLWSLRKEPRLPGWLSERMAAHGGKASG